MFLFHLLAMIHKGGFVSKLFSIMALAFALSPITYLLDKFSTWQIANEDYVSFVVGAIVVDHLLGSVYHAFWKRDFSLRKNLVGLMLKLFIIITMAYLFEGLNALMSEKSILKDYTIMILRLMVFLYPAGSAFGNSYEMTGRKFPPVGFMEKIKQFSESATVNQDHATIKEQHIHIEKPLLNDIPNTDTANKRRH